MSNSDLNIHCRWNMKRVYFTKIPDKAHHFSYSWVNKSNIQNNFDKFSETSVRFACIRIESENNGRYYVGDAYLYSSASSVYRVQISDSPHLDAFGQVELTPEEQQSNNMFLKEVVVNKQSKHVILQSRIIIIHFYSLNFLEVGTPGVNETIQVMLIQFIWTVMKLCSRLVNNSE